MGSFYTSWGLGKHRLWGLRVLRNEAVVAFFCIPYSRLEAKKEIIAERKPEIDKNTPPPSPEAMKQESQQDSLLDAAQTTLAKQSEERRPHLSLYP